ncbi:MAG: acyl-ACP--UDP-N-acetylglucosamine O-acyltransferase [Cyanobacteria bacterium]|nr:acyl-ACP--UDP-N-acetylglucosamine O-acyltransferase [Cyanobacteriota bacterium]
MTNHLKVHPTAIIDPTVVLAENVEIGPYSVIGPDCVIGDGSVLGPHVVIEGYTTLGKNCRISSGAVLGGLPQDLHFGGEKSFIEVGDGVVIRECVTISRATGEDKITRVGDGCMLMAYSHLAHNCQLGQNVILANNVQLAGYVEIGDNAFIGGTCAVHQFVKIGRLAIVGGFSGTRQDIPPFAMTEGRPQATIRGVNSIGLKRKGFDREARLRIKKAYFYLWFSKLNLNQAIEAIRSEIEPDPNIEELISFTLNSKRGIHRPDDSLQEEVIHTSVDTRGGESVLLEFEKSL